MMQTSYEKRMKATFLVIVILAVMVTAAFAAGAVLVKLFIFP